jgi:hypothetical protein
MWELRMPKAANQFDYRTIADVLITIEYTALNSFDYQQQVIQGLNARPAFSANRPFSFRHEFADQWYDLHNPDQTATPMVVRFETVREDFPPNLEDISLSQLLLSFGRSPGRSFEVSLNFTSQGDHGPVGGPALTIDGVISTAAGSAGGWMSMKGKLPIGIWELALPDTPEMRSLFDKGEIEDILLVITYSGRTPEYPS